MSGGVWTMSTLQIAPVGAENDGIIVALKEYSVSKLVLIYTETEQEYSLALSERLAPLRLVIDRRLIEGDPLVGALREITRVLHEDGHEDALINVSSGPRLLTHSALCAAYINGTPAIYVRDGEIVELPILHFGYSDLLSTSKLGILSAIADAGGAVDSLSALSSSSGVEKSLLSYHLRGGHDTKGLEDLGLVTIQRRSQGRLGIALTPIGRLIQMGHED